MSDEKITIQQCGRFFEDCRDQLECVVPVNRIPPVDKVIAVNFVAYVTIPAGFVIASSDYLSILNINTSELSINYVTDTAVCIGGNYMRVAEVALLEGTINVNVVLDGFAAVCPVRSEGLGTYTAFSYNATLSVSKVLAFSRYSTQRLIGYRLCPKQGVPFAVNNRGVVYYKDGRNSGFMQYLDNCTFERVIQVPYTIFIQPYQANFDNMMNV